MARPLLSVEGITKTYGTRTLLDNVSLGVSEGDRIGIVGRNGGGKTTLLEILAGRTPPDAGRVVRTGDMRVTLLRQADELPATTTVRSAVLGDRADHEWAGDAAVRDVLTGLLGGLDADALPGGLDSAFGSLSGGERRRVGLAAMLTAPLEHASEVLLLDEPTNHLDVEGVDWLASHLRGRRSLKTGGFIVVTHDRWFLDAVCESTWEVHGGSVYPYEGSYAAYVLAKAERSRQQAAEESKRQNLLRKELAWLRRGPPARTTKPQFRIDAANALIEAEPPARDPATLMRFAASRLGRTVVELENADVRAGDATLLKSVTWQLGPGDRIGVVGVNGAGKTTFLRLLAGETEPASGERIEGVTVKVGYLSQEVRELPRDIGVDRRVLEAVQDVKLVLDLGNGKSISASQLCEQFGFTGERQRTPIRDLSGGERRRLQLLRLLMEGPNVLLLDEPTNDLDVETLNALEDLLDGWAGSLVVVTHDRYFLERTCDRTLGLLGDGNLRDLPGGIEEYLKLRRGGGSGRTSDKGARAAAKEAAKAVPSVSAVDERAGRKELGRIERQMEKLTAREAELHKALADSATDFGRLSDLDAELREVLSKRGDLEEQWLVLSEELD